jgi:hypothetical protein
MELVEERRLAWRGPGDYGPRDVTDGPPARVRRGRPLLPGAVRPGHHWDATLA